MPRRMIATRSGMIIAGAILALAGCEDAPDESTDDMPMEEMEGMEGGETGGMEMDSDMMERHANEAEAMAAEVRSHVEEFRSLSPEAQQERISDHTAVVARMLSLVDRQMQEMSMGMSMSDEEMGAMMGMSAEEHRHMMEEMAAVRSEAEELQVAPVERLRTGMPGHLDRLEAMAEMLEDTAAAMRAM